VADPLRPRIIRSFARTKRAQFDVELKAALAALGDERGIPLLSA